MSVHFDVSKISFFGLDEWSVAVCAWRGCCIEVFARAEHSVAECILALEAAGIRLSNEAHHPGAVARLRALDECLLAYDFQGHEKMARHRIAAWQEHCDMRTLLAHGKLKAIQTGLRVEPITISVRKGETATPKSFSRFEMLELLADLERCQLLLHQQLGHIKALAGTAKPVKGSKKPGPDPRPAPGQASPG
jgi:hypothetical protein